MPKIQLSALATDMKGKSGGSVFARNKGGLYFRANPKPVQKKSYKWQGQKANFTRVSSSWRSLTNVQRVAWETMAVNYPATDAWGNEYTPSGYQLYMRLNTVLLSHELPMLSVPQMPKELPVDDDILVYSPNFEAFTPTKGASLMGFNSRNFYLLAKDFLQAASLTTTSRFSIRLMPSDKSTTLYAPGQSFPCVQLFSTDNSGFFAFITFANGGRIILTVAYNFFDESEAEASQVQTFDVTDAYSTNQLHLIFDFAFKVDFTTRLYVNGVAPTPILTTYYDAFQTDELLIGRTSGNAFAKPDALDIDEFTGTLRVGNWNNQPLGFLIASDIRFFDSDAMGRGCACTTGEDCPEDYDCRDCECYLVWDDAVSYSEVAPKLLYRGYILGNESVIYPLNHFTDNSFTNTNPGDYPSIVLTNDEDCCAPGSDCTDFTDQECQDCCCVYVGDDPWPEQTIPVTYSPFVLVTFNQGAVDDFYIGIYSSKPIGLGRSDFNNPYLLLKTSPLDGNSIDVSDEIQKYFGSVQANSKLVLDYQLINSTTGQDIKVKPKCRTKAKKSVRFKAGSELSSSVS